MIKRKFWAIIFVLIFLSCTFIEHVPADEIFRKSKLISSASCLDMISRKRNVIDEHAVNKLHFDPETRRRYNALVINYLRRCSSKRLENKDIGIFSFSIKPLLSLLPLFGHIANEAIDHGKEVIERDRDIEITSYLHRGLLEIENNPTEFADFNNSKTSDNERLKMIEAKLESLVGPDGVFHLIEDDLAREEIQSSAIRILSHGFRELRKVSAVNRSDISKLIKKIEKLSKAIAEVEDANKRLQQYSSDEGPKQEKKPKPPKKSTLKTTIPILSKEKANIIKKVRDHRKMTNQVESAAGILYEIGARDEARVLNFASGAIALSGAIAYSTVDPTAILPTVLSGIKFMKAFTGNSEASDPIEPYLKHIIALQHKTHQMLKDIHSMIEKNHEEVMASLDIINENVLVNRKYTRELFFNELRTCTDLVRPGSYFDMSDINGNAGMIKQSEPIRFDDYDSFIDHVTVQAKDSIRLCKDGLIKYLRPINGEVNIAFHVVNSQYIKFTKKDKIHTFEEQRVLLDRYLNDLAINFLNFVIGYITKEGQIAMAFPALTVSKIDEKTETFSKMSHSDIQEYELLTHNLGNLLSPVAVRRYAGLLAGTHFYFEMTDSSQKPYARDELLTMKKTNRKGKELLDWAKTVLNISLAQESLNCGDIMLPIVYAAVVLKDDRELLCGKWEGSEFLKRNHDECSDSYVKDGAKAIKKLVGLEANSSAKGLLATNRLLAKNFMLYLVTKELEASNTPPFIYEVAYRSKGQPELLDRIFPNKWEFRWEDKPNEEQGILYGWHIVIAGEKYPLPSPEEVYDGRFTVTPSLIGLLQTRQKVISEIVGYEMLDHENGLTDLEKEWIKELMIAGASPF